MVKSGFHAAHSRVTADTETRHSRWRVSVIAYSSLSTRQYRRRCSLIHSLRAAALGLPLAILPVTSAEGQVSNRFDPYNGQELPLRKGLEIRAGVDGPAELTAPRAILTDSNHIYVLDPTAFGVHRFDDHGTWLGTIGREGDGPGEFRRPTAMGWLADTLWVADRGLGRLSLFDRSGGFLRSVRFSIMSGSTVLMPQRVLAGGGIVSIPSISVASIGAVDSLPVLLFDEEGMVQDTLAWQAVGHVAVSVVTPALGSGSGQRTMSISHPFDRRSLIAFDPMGRWLYLATWRTTAESDASLELLQVTPTNHRAVVATLPLGRVSLSPRDLQAHVHRIHHTLPESFRSVVSAQELTRIFQQQVSRPSQTLTDAMVAGADGTIWLRKTSEDPVSAPERWAAYRPGDGFVGFVRLPTAHFLLGVTGHKIWTVSWDDVDLPTITAWVLRERRLM